MPIYFWMTYAFNYWKLLVFVPLFFVSVPASAQENKAGVAPKTAAPIVTKERIRDKVKNLRENRFKALPYLDRAYIRSTINAEKVQDKSLFITGSEKKAGEILDRAIRVHTPARAARERIALAKRRILAALRALFPEAEFEFNEKEGRLSGVDFNSFNYRFSFRQPIFRGGVLWHTLLQEQAGLEAAKREYDAVINDLMDEVLAAYFEYVRSEETARDHKQGIDKLRSFVDISKKKFEAQIISEIERLNTESLYSQMEYEYETTKQEVELAKLELQRFLDLDTEDELRVTQLYAVNDLIAKSRSVDSSDPGVSPAGPPAQKIEKSVYNFEGLSPLPKLGFLVDLAYQNRPELRVEAAKLQSARLEERVKWGALMPHADAVLEFGELGEAFDVNSTDPFIKQEFRFLLELNWNALGNKVEYNFENDERAPSVTQFLSGAGTQISRNTFKAGLWDGLSDLASAKEAEVARLDQVIELEKAEKEAVHDVKQAYFDYEKAQIQVRSILQRVDYRKRLAELTEHRLGQNEVQISEYLQAEIDLAREISALHKALADYYKAKSKLNHAVGIRNYLKIEETNGK